MRQRLIDTHAHLYFDQYKADLDSVILKSQEAGLEAILNIGIDAESSLHCIQMAETYSMLFAAIGVHPHDVSKIAENELEMLFEQLNHPKVVAIGEVGLDFYHNLSSPESQRKQLKIFLDWSLETGKPLIIHTREADEAILKIITDRQKNNWQGVFHCFSGNSEMATKVLELGFHISFAGNLTFKNSSSVNVMKNIPIERLLIETDSPFLTPIPYRGKRNEPAYVKFVADKIAEIKNMTIEQVAEQTTQNAITLFRLPI